jgi:hypothetical protein
MVIAGELRMPAMVSIDAPAKWDTDVGFCVGVSLGNADGDRAVRGFFWR